MSMRRVACLLIALALVSAGCLTGVDPSADPADEPRDGLDGHAGNRSAATPHEDDARGQGRPGAATDPSRDTKPSTTVAVVDSGANLYHEAFRANGSAPPAVAPGATPVNLTLDAGDWRSAVDADWSTLTALERGELYTIPGTRYVGAISFREVRTCLGDVDELCSTGEGWPRLLDDPGNYSHGTQVAGRVAAEDLSLGGEDPRVGLVLVQTTTNASGFVEGIEWATEQPWIDAMVLSVGARPGSGHQASFLRAVDEAAHTKPVFKAAGNGLPPAPVGHGQVPKPTWAWDGTPDEIAVGGVDNEDLYKNGDLHPYVAADACRTPKVPTDSMSGTTKAGDGTSFAAPYAAGAAARLILEARDLLGDAHVGPRVDEALGAPEDTWRSGHAGDANVVLARGDPSAVEQGPVADGTFTLRELKDVLYHTASPAPTSHPHDGDDCYGHQIPAEPLPPRTRFASMGYGEVNEASLDRALAVLQGSEELPDRSTADEAYVRAHTLRSATLGPRTTTSDAPGALDGQPARPEPLTSP